MIFLSKFRRLFIIEREAKDKITAFWTTAKGFCDEIKTIDGTYFVAYIIPQKKAYINTETEQILKKELLIDLQARKNPFTTKVLGSRQVEKMQNLIR